LKRVLFLDDELEILELVEELFEMAGLEAVTASNPKAALDLLEKESFDAIVSDIVMPEMSGIEFFHIVKDKGKLVSPFVFITGFAAENEKIDELIGNGVDKLFLKPLQIYEIAEYIKKRCEE